jgi:hypothetical protein
VVYSGWFERTSEHRRVREMGCCYKMVDEDLLVRYRPTPGEPIEHSRKDIVHDGSVENSQMDIARASF